MPRDRSTMSQKPSAVRGRIKRANKRLEAATEDIGIFYNKPVEEWDFEELQRGRPRSHNGRFTGAKPAWITGAVLAEAQKRLKSLTKQELHMHANAAIAVIADLMVDDRVDRLGKPVTSSATKLQAATYVLDHIIGKSTAHVEVEGSLQLNQMLAAVIINPDGQDAFPAIVPGEWTATEDDDDGLI
jgi:hypothetical protein